MIVYHIWRSQNFSSMYVFNVKYGCLQEREDREFGFKASITETLDMGRADRLWALRDNSMRSHIIIEGMSQSRLLKCRIEY